jgi:hypothetical protein
MRVVIRCQYECRSGYDAGTDASRPASGRSRYLPRLNFRGALTALRNRNSARVQLRQKTTRGLFKSFVLSPVFGARHEHKEPQERSHEVQRKSVAGA